MERGWRLHRVVLISLESNADHIGMFAMLCEIARSRHKINLSSGVEILFLNYFAIFAPNPADDLMPENFASVLHIEIEGEL